jgi:phosphoribosyl 1,2-cyclic phosphodiesterase
MRATIWGCRGSLAAPGPGTVRYGGNTSCVEVQTSDDTLIVLDAGTGIRLLGLELQESCPPVIHLMLTHLHLDHLEGLGFFAPLYLPEIEIHVWGPPSPVQSLRERVERYLSPPLFPVELSDIPSRISFHDVPEEPWEIGAALISAAPLKHPGPTVGYRIEDEDRSLVYMPDHEPALGSDLRTVPPSWISGFDLAKGADVLMHDAQYTAREYGERVGWGHSALEHVVDFALVAKVERLLMTHHDPLHDDEKLERMLAEARGLWGEGPGDLVLAREGMTIVPGEEIEP